MVVEQSGGVAQAPGAAWVVIFAVPQVAINQVGPAMRGNRACGLRPAAQGLAPASNVWRNGGAVPSTGSAELCG